MSQIILDLDCCNIAISLTDDVEKKPPGNREIESPPANLAPQSSVGFPQPCTEKYPNDVTHNLDRANEKPTMGIVRTDLKQSVTESTPQMRGAIRVANSLFRNILAASLYES